MYQISLGDCDIVNYLETIVLRLVLDPIWVSKGMGQRREKPSFRGRGDTQPHSKWNEGLQKERRVQRNSRAGLATCQEQVTWSLLPFSHMEGGRRELKEETCLGLVSSTNSLWPGSPSRTTSSRL